jgi:2-polyprenyl-3-methyl-5-hydroxy-6-metoxy-1,4-benzoquinol methylase
MAHGNESENIQSRYYDRIASLYDVHQNEKEGLDYRRLFVYKFLFGDFNFSGKKCLDAMCGGGEWSDYLSSRGAEVVGLDISKRCCQIYKNRYPNNKIICRSILDSGIEDNLFDLVVTDSLHHVQPFADKAIDEIYRLLKPGGYLFFWEPHKGSLMNLLRKVWYRHDIYFEKNEEALDLKDLKRKNISRFVFEREKYGGGIAYLLVSCSMLFRIPPDFKKYYAKPLFLIEKIFSLLNFSFSSWYVMSCWQKK